MEHQNSNYILILSIWVSFLKVDILADWRKDFEGVAGPLNNSFTASNSRLNGLKLIEKLDKQIVKVFASNGWEHIIAINAQGEVFAMGYNAKGQLGIGNWVGSPLPKQIESLKSKFVTTVGLSYFHTIFACGDDLETYSSGRNDHGQLGLGNNVDVWVPTLIESLNGKKVTSIGWGQYHTILATNASEVYAFGRNDSGQLGISHKIDSKETPSLIEGIFCTKIAWGYYHSVGITPTGKLYSWGRNDSGQLGVQDKGKHYEPSYVKDFEDIEIIDISWGWYHTLALTSDFKVFSFGRNCHGQLGNDTK